MCSCILSLPSALDGVGGQRNTPAAITPAKEPVNVVQGVGCIPGLAWTNAEKPLVPLEFHLHTVQPIASRCTD